MADFIVGIQDAATGAITAVVSGISEISTAVIASPVVMFSVGVGLLFLGIKFIPRMIRALKR